MTLFHFRHFQLLFTVSYSLTVNDNIYLKCLYANGNTSQTNVQPASNMIKDNQNYSKCKCGLFT